MKSWAIMLAASCCLAGCRAPMPQMKDLSPYGATRVQPPQTGSFGTADAYYQPPTSTGSKPAPNARSELSGAASPLIVTSDEASRGSANEELSWRSPANRSPRSQGQGSVAQVGYDEPLADEQYTPGSTLSIIEATPPPRAITLGGMPINDATQPAEPAPFRPQGAMQPMERVRDISELPEPNEAVRARIRSAGSPTTANPSGANTNNSNRDAGGWRLR